MSLFISNIHHSFTEEDLYEKFKTIGEIEDIYIDRNKLTCNSNVCGYIRFQDEKIAELVLRSTTYDLLNEEKMHITRAISVINPIELVGNIVITNLHLSIDEVILKLIFEKYGEILSSRVVHNLRRLSPGVGFVKFETESSADEAIKGVNDYLIKGMKVTVCKYEDAFTNIYLKPLPLSLTDQQLYELCLQCGNILSAQTVTKFEGEPICTGFVTFENAISALTAITNLNGFVFYGRILNVGRPTQNIEE